VISDRDNHGVNILAVEDCTIVASGRDLAIVDGFLSGYVTCVIKVANCHALNARDHERRRE
jgi:hypothetical protein